MVIRTIVIVLLVFQAAVLSVPMMLTAVRLHMHAVVRRSILEQAPPHTLCHIVLSKPQFEAHKRDEGKELFVGDKMYDIVRTSELGDSISVVCVSDDAETALHAAIRADENKAMKNDGRVNNLMRLIVPTQFAVLNDRDRSEPAVSKQLFVCSTPACKGMLEEPLVPPPRWIVDHIVTI